MSPSSRGLLVTWSPHWAIPPAQLYLSILHVIVNVDCIEIVPLSYRGLKFGIFHFRGCYLNNIRGYWWGRNHHSQWCVILLYWGWWHEVYPTVRYLAMPNFKLSNRNANSCMAAKRPVVRVVFPPDLLKWLAMVPYRSDFSCSCQESCFN